ncbi:MAG: manganese efflux pump MntP family protein [candidate division KSB1 bacterium]|nr:manganese efflux pump MntP family protein [candidate division KSB1 bacterium]MDZ7294937.1 manganese efflux pump MntP family protein [candidate division KSB1 bacterium]MDZ7337993.1 manganese efflux pump MntP family protein [candidate division KSB1 bacterium]MDZ7384972.1 manganese efflux pump MntP family protein [candidate division KSB1 bacterium]MDZ7391544.1 manganese efflux pump MntP family protein [candidate division KSB1 bacterium]
MELVTVAIIALGLAMDATAVAAGIGATLDPWRARTILRLAFHFGLFQFFMPLVGWGIGEVVSSWVGRYDHWMAFALLAGVAGHMLYQSRRPAELPKNDPTRGLSLVLLSLATSIDALAVGLSLAVLRMPVLYASGIIGVVAFALSGIGGVVGHTTRKFFGRSAQVAGALILLAVAIRIVVSHLGRGI